MESYGYCKQMGTYGNMVEICEMSSSVINLSMKRYEKFLQDPAMQRSLFEALVFEDTMESHCRTEAAPISADARRL